MTERQGSTPNPNPIINEKGDLNRQVWQDFEINVNGRTPRESLYLFQEAVTALPEPPVATKSGKPNQKWLSWYKARRQCRRQVALSMCKKIISGEVKEYDVKPVSFGL